MNLKPLIMHLVNAVPNPCSILNKCSLSCTQWFGHYFSNSTAHTTSRESLDMFMFGICFFFQISKPVPVITENSKKKKKDSKKIILIWHNNSYRIVGTQIKSRILKCKKFYFAKPKLLGEARLFQKIII